MVGTKPVSARFDLLPNTKPRMSALGTSLIIQIALAAFLVIVPLLFPQQMIPKAMYMVTSLEGPPLDIPAPPPPKPPAVQKVKVQPTPPPPPVVRHVPKMDVAKYFAPPKVVQPPKVREAELPKVNETFQPVKMDLATPNQPARPREAVKTGVMTGGSSQLRQSINRCRSIKCRRADLVTRKVCLVLAIRTSTPISLNSGIPPFRQALAMATAQAERTALKEL